MLSAGGLIPTRDRGPSGQESIRTSAAQIVNGSTIATDHLTTCERESAMSTITAASSSRVPVCDQAAEVSASRPGAQGPVQRPDNHVIVLFGATGDLAHRKLLPGLFHLAMA